MSQQIYGSTEVLLACLVTVAFDELRRFQFGRSLIHFADDYLWLSDSYILYTYQGSKNHHLKAPGN